MCNKDTFIGPKGGPFRGIPLYVRGIRSRGRASMPTLHTVDMYKLTSNIGERAKIFSFKTYLRIFSLTYILVLRSMMFDHDQFNSLGGGGGGGGGGGCVT